MVNREEWIREASEGLQSDFGVHEELADAVAAILFEREGDRIDPLSSVSFHMSTDEILVDPDTFECSK
jgi:hypothetical protein